LALDDIHRKARAFSIEAKMHWQQLAPGLWLYPNESCNVYAIEGTGPNAAITIIDAGTGEWMENIGELPLPVVALACTHYFRDHSAGAARAAAAGIPVYVPEYERAIFEDPEQHFRERETYIIYDNLWDLYTPAMPIRAAGILRDYDRITLAGTEFEVIPLPGVTMSQSGLAFSLQDGRRAVLCGEAIHSPGRLARIAPLQYNYNDLSGAVQCFYSASQLAKYAPDILLPSLGAPITEHVNEALTQLKENLRRLVAVRPGVASVLDHQSSPRLHKVTDHVWKDSHSVATTWYIISESGKALALDYGYNSATCSGWQGYARPARRRALLHGLDGLKERFGIDRIDVVLVSHFHDDHVCGIPVLQRLFGTECWAAENFADLLEHPESHCFPCNWPIASKVDRRLKLDKEFTWEEYTFRLHPMSGHTRFASLIGFEADSKRFAHTGDQYFFNNGVQSFEGNSRAQNHVFRNGALLDGYQVSGDWMQSWRPDVVLQGHQDAMWTDEAFFKHISEWNRDYADLANAIMPLGEADAHFNLDSWGGWIWPYRTHLEEASPFDLKVVVRNPFPGAAVLTVSPILPAGWSAETAVINAGPREEASCIVTVHPAGICRRQPIAVDLIANGKRFGQVAEALVTIGCARF
jgi:glyoxylase-like metal-dependent hydrolase (beta-lactamase superfamily II)